MTPEATAIVNDFLNDGSYRFHKPRVAEIVGGNVKDFTNWEARSLLLFPPQKVGTRVMMTRDGVIEAGIMSELAWLIGPENAAAAAKAIWEDYFARSPHGFDLDTLVDQVIYFRKPTAHIDVPSTPRFPSEDEDVWTRISGFPLHHCDRAALEREPIPNETTVILPIGRLIAKWAMRADSVLRG